jgi:HD-like signal output (HDOD) protein
MTLEALEARLLRELDGGRASLPILPHAATAALRFANDPNSDLRKLATLVEGDPPIAARLLAVANSVIYTRAVRVSTTRGAIIRLGLSGTRDLLFQVAYANSMIGMARYQDLVVESFKRSVLTGLAARAISDKLRLRFEYDYLCGLLHDIGEARIYRILAALPEPSEGVLGVRELVRRHHCRAGAELATAWRLPEPIIEGCRHHHDGPAKASPLVRMIMMADILVGLMDVGSSSQALSKDSSRLPPGDGAAELPRAPAAEGAAELSGEPRILLSPPSLNSIRVVRGIYDDDDDAPPIVPAALCVSDEEYELRVIELEALGLRRDLVGVILDKLRTSEPFV